MLQDLHYAVRMLRKNPRFALAVIAILTLGIGANSAIFNVVDALLLTPPAYADPDHLYEIGSVDAKGTITGASLADFTALREHPGVFSGISVDQFWSSTLTDRSGDAERMYGRALSAGTLALLGVAPRIGRIFGPEDFRPDAPHAALLSDRLWRRRYASNPHITGQIIRLDGESYTVIGVMPHDFAFPVSVYDIWTPWIFSGPELMNRRAHSLVIYARLRDGANIAQAQAQLDAFAHAAATQFPVTEKDWHPRIGPNRLGANDQLRSELLTLLGAVALVLLIACLNVANLLLARAAGRRREVALRMALGASRARIVRQLITETLLLTSIGAVAGLVAAYWGARILMSSFPVGPVRPRLEYPGLNAAVLGFTIGISLVAGIVFGLAPALRLSRPDLNRDLKDSGRTISGGWRKFSLRGLLIVAETSLSLILLIGAGLMIRSVVRMLEVNPGFRPENVLTVEVPVPSFLSAVTSLAERKEIEARQTAEYADLIDRIRKLPGVIAAGAGTVLPLGPAEVRTQVGFEGDLNPKQNHGAQLAAVSDDYFRALGIPLLAGRAFTEADRAGSVEVAIVNDVIARRYWPNENPIGKHVNMSGLPVGPWYEVVGVVTGIHHRQLADALQPEIYRPYRQYLGPAFAALLAVRTTRDPTSLASAIRQQIRTLYPTQPIGAIRPMTDVVNDSVALPKFYTGLLSVFAGLAMVLALAGIYAVMSFSVAQRTREVGIRMAMGATAAIVVRLIMHQGLSLVFAGVILGMAGAAAATRIIRAQLYATTPTDPATFVFVSLLLVAAAGIAAYFPASRAAEVDPVKALRDE